MQELLVSEHLIAAGFLPSWRGIASDRLSQLCFQAQARKIEHNVTSRSHHQQLQQSGGQSTQITEHRLLDLETNRGCKGISISQTTVSEVHGTSSYVRYEQEKTRDHVNMTNPKPRVTGNFSRDAVREEDNTTTYTYCGLPLSNTRLHSQLAGPQQASITAKPHHRSTLLKSGWYVLFYLTMETEAHSAIQQHGLIKLQLSPGSIRKHITVLTMSNTRGKQDQTKRMTHLRLPLVPRGKNCSRQSSVSKITSTTGPQGLEDAKGTMPKRSTAQIDSKSSWVHPRSHWKGRNHRIGSVNFCSLQLRCSELNQALPLQIKIRFCTPGAFLPTTLPFHQLP